MLIFPACHRPDCFLWHMRGLVLTWISVHSVYLVWRCNFGLLLLLLEEIFPMGLETSPWFYHYACALQACHQAGGSVADRFQKSFRRHVHWEMQLSAMEVCGVFHLVRDLSCMARGRTEPWCSWMAARNGNWGHMRTVQHLGSQGSQISVNLLKTRCL